MVNLSRIRIFKVEKISTHGGSIRVYVKKGKKNKINSSVKQILEEEEKFGIKKYKTYSDFAERIFKLKKNVIRNIKKLKENNSKIIGYGAPAKATTALNFFNINKEIDFIVEDNKLKHGKYVPGVNIPIFSKYYKNISFWRSSETRQHVCVLFNQVSDT